MIFDMSAVRIGINESGVIGRGDVRIKVDMSGMEVDEERVSLMIILDGLNVGAIERDEHRI